MQRLLRPRTRLRASLPRLGLTTKRSRPEFRGSEFCKRFHITLATVRQCATTSLFSKTLIPCSNCSKIPARRSVSKTLPAFSGFLSWCASNGPGTLRISWSFHSRHLCGIAGRVGKSMSVLGHERDRRTQRAYGRRRLRTPSCLKCNNIASRLGIRILY
jgi:hypothetical protein